MRGSSRASVKALIEQDKQLSELQLQLSRYERENVKLKTENRTIRDIEVKLKDANNEINRLRNVLG